MESAISIRGLRKTFGNQTVLDGVDLEIPQGRTTVIIGRSGGGKSVLLKHLLGLLQPDEGSVILDEVDIARADASERMQHLKNVGMLFQNAALFDSLNVFDNVAFPLREHTRMKKAEIRERVQEKLTLVGLAGFEHKLPSELSGGMRKRVGLARAIVMNPGIVFYDEPTTGLDPIMTGVVDDLIINTQREMNLTNVVISHDMKATMRMAHKIAFLFEGKIIFDDDPERLEESEDPRIQQFLEGRADGPIQVAQ